jgi:hypothetical protein
MRRMRHAQSLFRVTLWLAAFSGLPACAFNRPQPVTVRVTPAVIRIGTFYGHARVRVDGTVPPGAEVLIAVRGADATQVFRPMKRFGPIWIKGSTFSISGVPSLLLVFSSAPLRECLSLADRDRLRIDAMAINKAMEVSPPQRVSRLAGDFLKLETLRGSYHLEGGGIRLLDAGEGRQRFTLEFHWPEEAGPGDYAVTVNACQDGAVRDSVRVTLKVMETSFPAMMADLARDRAATYGFISIAIAVAAGFGIDFMVTRLFKKKLTPR